MTTKVKPGPEKGSGGRPRKKIDLEKVEALAQYHCTAQEIVAHLAIFDKKVSYDTVERRIKEKTGLTFAEFIRQKHMARAKPMLRQLQWKAAQNGNVAMLIWLGKQYLGQRDHRLEEISAEVTQRTGVLVVPGILNKDDWQEAADASVETK